MSYNLSQLPLKFDNAGRIRSDELISKVILVIILSICVIANIATLLSAKGHLFDRDTLIAVALPWLFPAILFLISMFAPKTDPQAPGIGSSEPSEMMIDSIGIHITRGARRWDYCWIDIQSATVRVINPPGNSRSHVEVIQIRRKGTIILDRYADLIDSSFGITIADLSAIIKMGIEQFGLSTSDSR